MMDAVRSLADGSGFQGRYWVSYELPSEDFRSNLRVNIEVLYYDVMILPDPAMSVGGILTSKEEAGALAQLAHALAPVIDRLPDPPDAGYFDDAGWNNVIEKAALALGVLEKSKPVKTRSSLLECNDHWIVPLEDDVVVQCRYDYALTLAVREFDPYEVRISEPFTLYNPDGTVGVFDPEGDPRKMGSSLRLLRHTVTRAIAHKDGRLEIDFDDGSCLRVPAGDHYEAWDLAGPEGALMVSIPGGDLAVWSE